MKFKKSIAALLAAVMVIGMVSCGSSKDDDEDEDEDDDKPAITTMAEEKEKAETEETADEPETTTEAETTTAAETTTEAPETEEPSEPAAETGYANGVFTGDGYTISVDESKWEYGEQAGVDVAFTYIAGGDDALKSASSLNVVSMSTSMLDGMSPSDYADSIRSAYDSMSGYNVTAEEEGKLNGYETYNFTVSYEVSGYTMVIKQVILSNDDTLAAISYGAFDEYMDELQPEFDEILKTMKFN